MTPVRCIWSQECAQWKAVRRGTRNNMVGGPEVKNAFELLVYKSTLFQHPYSSTWPLPWKYSFLTGNTLTLFTEGRVNRWIFFFFASREGDVFFQLRLIKLFLFLFNAWYVSQRQYSVPWWLGLLAQALGQFPLIGNLCFAQTFAQEVTALVFFFFFTWVKNLLHFIFCCKLPFQKVFYLIFDLQDMTEAQHFLCPADQK